MARNIRAPCHVVKTLFGRIGQFFRGRAYPQTIVASRSAVRAPAFGQWLQLLRAGRKRPVVVRQMERYGVKIDPSTLARFEREGRVPDLPQLLALCGVYKKDIFEALAVLIPSLELPIKGDQSCQTVGVQDASTLSPFTRGVESYGASSIGLLTQELRSLARTFTAAVEQVADRIDAAGPNRPHGGQPPATGSDPPNRF